MKSRHYSWHLDGLIAAALLMALWRLQPLMPDGDGLAHALRAIYSTYRDGIDVKHPLYAAFLRTFYQLSVATDLQAHAFALLNLSSHLATVGIFLILARCLYPMFMDKTLASLSAAGTVVSYGLLSRGSTIESYTPALCADLVLVCFIVSTTLRPLAVACIAAVLFLIALGFHITNVLMGPLVLVLLVHRVSRTQAIPTLAVFSATVLAGLAIFASALLLWKGFSLWPPDLVALRPAGDAQPPMSFLVRLGRAFYGMSRTVAYLPPVRELTLAFGFTYLAAFGVVGLGLLYLAWRGLFLRINAYWPLLTLLAIWSLPFMALGIYYFPSDPERWLFLLPVVWFIIGLIVDSDRTRQLPTRAVLAILIACIASYNVYQLLPQTQFNRQLAGLQELAKRVSVGDLVISPGGINSRIYEFFIRPYPVFDNITITGLVTNFRADRHGLEMKLQSQIMNALDHGHRVYIHYLMDEGHKKGENYPWAHLTEYDYGPETFISMLLHDFALKPVVRPTAESTGTFEIVNVYQDVPR